MLSTLIPAVLLSLSVSSVLAGGGAPTTTTTAIPSKPTVPVSAFTESQLYDRHWSTLSTAYSYATQSGKSKILQTRVLPANTFDAGCTGRITPFGLMKDTDDIIDYFYGAFGNNNANNGLVLFPSIVSFQISAFANTGAAAHAFVDLTTITTNVNLASTFAQTPLSQLTCREMRKICGDSYAPTCETLIWPYSVGEAATLNDNTFSAVPLSRNRCKPIDYNAYFTESNPRLFGDTPVPSASAALQTNYQEAKYTVFNTYNLTTYPNNLQIVKTSVVHGIPPPRTFANTTGGRIWPIGTFTNAMDTIEYQFGIFGNQDSRDTAAAIIPVINSFEIKAFVVRGTLRATYPLRVQGFFRLDSAYNIVGYDVQVQNTGLFYAKVGLNTPKWLEQPVLAGLVCDSVAKACTGVDQQYNAQGKPDCFNFLSSVVPFGDNNQVQGDSLACRSIHVNLAFLRPDIHCPMLDLLVE
ncbi:hypothetical protein BCR33DRAFT_840907 [Rhizoclosmatium globosum]|uniref:Uncharacterized protein n=1 Tax=Rhizoclosmatium globosum TaxID=329046 RepID=A0A1Y2CSE8_9FUNG|nr:hypothetical protein BCR33DRAFT_840907 [Rhizoclosmatium globosum]|eukprot:ORY49816.1 hypothetical protein BCR33DRAFT_840907 [Rhizoclosmatium globosum]